MGKGLLITFEGIDGSGKSHHSRLLHEWLQVCGVNNVVFTREPGGCALGQRIRSLLLEQSQEPLAETAEVLLFAADRAQHVADVIKPAVDNGRIVICDRYIDSFIAYQGGGRQMPSAILEVLNDFSVQGYRPDITFYMRVSPEVAAQRRGGEHDRIEQEDGQFYARVAECYERLLTAEPQRFVAIDNNVSEKAAFAAVQKEARERLAQYGYEL